MTTASDNELYSLPPKDRERYGYARAVDACYDAMRQLFDFRRKQGLKQVEIAAAIGKDEAWISRKLQGPGNLTLRTFGSLVEALDGRVEIRVVPKERSSVSRNNFTIYSEYCRDVSRSPAKAATDMIIAPRKTLSAVGT